ncbi:hypothetical protein B9Z55_019914 [Caenorhabditis nigoni]|uniref:Uncharacterized protein n=1 Tax=Caenorhabditis nigoni TaxID=1611254 RepID=A0A2G5TKD6_9PELO|nr:hypothetical protein B9Z55_019914 [Caenorhabditis nigoni]
MQYQEQLGGKIFPRFRRTRMLQRTLLLGQHIFQKLLVQSEFTTMISIKLFIKIFRPAATVIEMQATSTTDNTPPPPASSIETPRLTSSGAPDVPPSSSPPPPFESDPPTIQRNVSTRRSL